MNSKAYSILFCALLASTFVHELTAKQLVHHGHGQSRHHHGLTKIKDKANSLQCNLNCTGIDGTTEIQIVVNANLTLVGVVNVTASVAIVFDVASNLTAIFNGNTGLVVVFRLSTSQITYIDQGFVSGVWNKNVAFSVYLNGLVSLQFLLNISGAVTVSVSSLSTLSDAIKIKISAVINILIIKSVSVSEGVTEIISLSVVFVVSFSGSLKGGIAVIFGGALAAGQLVYVGSLNVFVSIVQGVGVFFAKVGSIQVLIDNSIQIDLLYLFGVGLSGAQRLVYLATLLYNAGVNVAVVFGNLTVVIGLLASFAVTVRETYAYQVIYTIISKNQASLEDAIALVVQVILFVTIGGAASALVGLDLLISFLHDIGLQDSPVGVLVNGSSYNGVNVTAAISGLWSLQTIADIVAFVKLYAVTEIHVFYAVLIIATRSDFFLLNRIGFNIVRLEFQFIWAWLGIFAIPVIINIIAVLGLSISTIITVVSGFVTALLYILGWTLVATAANVALVLSAIARVAAVFSGSLSFSGSFSASVSGGGSVIVG